MSEQTANLCTTDAAESLRAVVAERDREIERLKEGQSILILARDEQKRLANEYRDLWSRAALKAQPRGVALPEPYGWVAAGGFYTDREGAIAAAGKTPCIDVYSRPQMDASEDRSLQRQAVAEELARQLKASGDEIRELRRLNSSPVSSGDDDEYMPAGIVQMIMHSQEVDAVGLAVKSLTQVGGMDERADFEDAFEGMFYSACFERHESDEYVGRGLQGAWLGWQARAALSAPSHGEQVREWVPVSERLPDETHAYGCHTNDVLCRTRSGKVIVALLARTTTGDVWYDQQSKERDVTHWMPLPAAPSAGSQQGGE